MKKIIHSGRIYLGKKSFCEALIIERGRILKTGSSAELLAEGNPLTYADYHKLKKGKSPANAPSAIFNKI